MLADTIVSRQLFETTLAVTWCSFLETSGLLVTSGAPKRHASEPGATVARLASAVTTA
jgi:hypothetical protein